MKIDNLFTSGKPAISFEIFPPKRDGDFQSVLQTIDALALLKPDYISVTYGAAGSERNNDTLELASRIKREYGIEALAHLTSVGATKEDIKRILSVFEENQIENVLALRGDLPENPIVRDFKYAGDLVHFIKQNGAFGVGAACYPESHVESRSKTTDLIHLKQKVDQGVDFLVTQMFFDNEKFYEFKDEVRSLDINIPITVGIMPVLNKKQIERMVAISGAHLPEKFKKILNCYEDKPAALQDAGIMYACEQIVDLLSSGVDGIHLYVMNKPYVAKRILDNLSGILTTLR